LRKVCLTCKKEYNDDRASCPDDGGTLMPVLTDPLIGTVIADKYELLSVLGVGGMSTIYKAKHKYIGRIAAVKLLHPYLVSDASMFQRFQYEAKAASNLNHPNVVAVHDFGITADGKAYLVMDYLAGEDLATLLDKETFLPEEQAREVFRQACAGLDHAHSKGVIHRDLKPSNLFLCPEGDGDVIVKLVDFGIAKISEVPGEQSQSLTRTGEVFGSPLYMSPEQCSGKPLDNRSDLYSLGCLMYETLTGRRPLVGNTAIDTMHKHLKEKPLSFKEVAPDVVISQKMEYAVFRCLAKSPTDRFENVAALYLELFDQALPKSSLSASRTNIPSLNIELRADKAENESIGASAIQTSDFKFGPGLTAPQDVTALSSANAAIAVKAKQSKWPSPPKLALLSVFCFLVGVGYWLVFLWDGPVSDGGHLIDKWQYEYFLTRGDNLTSEGHYPEAEEELRLAQEFAKKLGDHYGRLMNVYRSRLTLYSKSNQFDKQADVIAQMSEVTRQRAHNTFSISMQEINRVDKLISDKVDGQSHMGERELEMRLSALINGIRSTAKQLGAVGDYEHQELLLTSTIKTYSKLVHDDDPQLAALDLDLAESHVSQDEFDVARPLFKKSLEIYRQAREHSKGQVSDLDVAKTWLRIGQFDRDRSNFKDGGVELNNAYNILKTFGSEKNAGLYNGQGIKFLIESLNALADYSDQINNASEAKKYRQEAIKVKDLRRKLKIGVFD